MLGRSVYMGCSVSLANILQQGALQQARTVGWSAACSRCWCCPHLLCCVSSLGLLGRPQHRLQQLVQLGSCHGCRGWGAAGLVCAGGGGGRAAELGGEGARAPALALDGQLTTRDTGLAHLGCGAQGRRANCWAVSDQLGARPMSCWQAGLTMAVNKGLFEAPPCCRLVHEAAPCPPRPPKPSVPLLITSTMAA